MGFLSSFFLGLVIGVGLIVGLHYLNEWRSRKRMRKAVEISQLSRMVQAEVKGICGEGMPNWIMFQEYERVRWLNNTLKKFWPHVSKAASAVIKDTVEPILEDYRPVGITSLKFNKLTLGTVAPQIAGVKVYSLPEKPGQSIMEMDFKWVGDPSIILGIGLPVGSLPVQVKDLGFTAKVRIIFKFTDKIPAIGAIVVSLRDKPNPDINYTLKAVGGSISAVPGLSDMIYDMIKGTVNDMLVWPHRIVVPLDDGDYSDLELKLSGSLEVKLVRGKGLKNVDMMGKSDPYVKLWTRVLWPVKSKVIDNNLNPEWNETFKVSVEEKETQRLVLEVKDEGKVRDERLGIVALPLASLEPEVLTEFTLDLLPVLDDDRVATENKLGSITIHVTYHKYTPEEQMAEMEKEKAIQLQRLREKGVLGSSMKAMSNVAGAAGKVVGAGVGAVTTGVGAGVGVVASGVGTVAGGVTSGVGMVAGGVGSSAKYMTGKLTGAMGLSRRKNNQDSSIDEERTSSL